MRIGPLDFHRKEQWDLYGGPTVIPFLAIHFRRPGSSRRLFVAWPHGVRVWRWEIVFT